ncbi:hypothetical protein EI555_012627 [Monodon monoceros]|uniref:Uncharacterized protein n=1 Tax=Monodon monoceros TaxID=40151 RepID=A0A4U1EVR4_MONMO|nr:hypothetical protein EI555_012627 [Monodon monoceros]
MSIARSSVHAKCCHGTATQTTAEVTVTRLVLDPCLLEDQYLNKRKTYFAHDALQQCTVGVLCFSELYLSREQSMWSVNWLRPFSRSSDRKALCRNHLDLESLVSLETTHLSKNLEELDLSSTQ